MASRCSTAAEPSVHVPGACVYRSRQREGSVIAKRDSAPNSDTPTRHAEELQFSHPKEREREREREREYAYAYTAVYTGLVSTRPLLES